MIKIKTLTVEADGTGGMDFTFDSPDDLARIWALTSNFPDYVTVSISNDISEETKDAIREAALRSMPQTKPPIPEGVYYHGGYFFSRETRQSMGQWFYDHYIGRVDEFPQGEPE